MYRVNGGVLYGSSAHLLRTCLAFSTVMYLTVRFAFSGFEPATIPAYDRGYLWPPPAQGALMFRSIPHFSTSRQFPLLLPAFRRESSFSILDERIRLFPVCSPPSGAWQCSLCSMNSSLACRKVPSRSTRTTFHSIDCNLKAMSKHTAKEDFQLK